MVKHVERLQVYIQAEHHSTIYLLCIYEEQGMLYKDATYISEGHTEEYFHVE